MSRQHFLERSTITFRNFLQIGCTLRFIPYRWNKITNNLGANDQTNPIVFNCQKNLHLYYTSFMWIRFLQSLVLREFSLVGALWCLALSSACLSFITMSLYTDELMHFSNRLLNKNLLSQQAIGMLLLNIFYPKCLYIN